MAMEDITNEFEYLQRSDHTYIFIIDTSGRTILHPMLPIPGQDFRADPFFVDIQFLEPNAGEAGIIDSMKRWISIIHTMACEKSCNARVINLNTIELDAFWHADLYMYCKY